MRKRTWLFALACMLGSTVVWGDEERDLPADAYGQMAVGQLSERVGHRILPEQRDHYVEHGVSIPVDGGTLAVVYGASGGDAAWHVVSYQWVYEAGTRAKNGGPPDDPNPNPPTGNGHPGDHQTHFFRIGDWEYTIRYEFMVQDGVLGWHITSFSSVYKPRTPPGPPHQQEK